MAVSGAPLPPPGWYPDPDDPEARRRFWDGGRWTERYAPAGLHLADPADPPRRLDALAPIAILGIVLISLIEVGFIIASQRYLDAGDSLLAGDRIAIGEITDAEELAQRVGIALIVGYLVVGPLTFLPWFGRAYGNIRRFGVLEPRWSQRWAVGSWFVPILNFFRPKQAANDIYRAGRPGAPSGRELFARPVSPLVHWWWAVFIAQGLVARVGAAMINEANSRPLLTHESAFEAIRDEQSGVRVEMASSVIALVAAVLAILVVRRITADQHRVTSDLADGESFAGEPATR